MLTTSTIVNKTAKSSKTSKFESALKVGYKRKLTTKQIYTGALLKV